ncbi:hypothetical protein MNB_SM-4-1676 [hydrothermal vent metagenome]|uniref:Uncharacterized protein n=1 Tax=hydrothermal vent metagenome TaxID=652676 RepID=A0A1W1CEQ1_9ZZZZ
MFEYANNGILVMGGIVFIFILFAMLLGAGSAMHKKEKFASKPMFIVMLVLIVIGIVHEGYSSKENAMSAYGAYDNDRVIKCSTLTTSYLVSKERGWSRYEEGFSKNDILLDIRSCSSGEE